ncbi:hypothetical protein J6590_049019 [Homalodisca vitripennis]|nr:hypothetical protein J6590_049019 [Homalodisca vitripennis]
MSSWGNSPPLSKLPKMAYRTIKEQVFSSFLLLVTNSTERILPKDADSVKMLPQVTMSHNHHTRGVIDLLSERRSDATLEEGDCKTILLILIPCCNLHLLSCSVRTHFETAPKDPHLEIPQNTAFRLKESWSVWSV